MLDSFSGCIAYSTPCWLLLSCYRMKLFCNDFLEQLCKFWKLARDRGGVPNCGGVLYFIKFWKRTLPNYQKRILRNCFSIMEGPAWKFLEESLQEDVTRKQMAESQKKKPLCMPAINGYSKLAFIIDGLSFFTLETTRRPCGLEDCLSFFGSSFSFESRK